MKTRFKAGDRVRHHDTPDIPGTVLKVLLADQGSYSEVVLYRTRWDRPTEGANDPLVDDYTAGQLAAA